MTRKQRLCKIIRVWAAMPDSPRKEILFQEARRLCRSIGYLRTLIQ